MQFSSSNTAMLAACLLPGVPYITLCTLKTTCSSSCCNAVQAAAQAKPHSNPSYGGGVSVQAYDPVFTEVDRAVLAELGVRVRSAERLR